MITQVRNKLPGRTFGAPPVSDPLKVNGGAMSFILADIEEKLREAVSRGQHEKLLFEINLTDRGLLDYYPMTGTKTRFDG